MGHLQQQLEPIPLFDGIRAVSVFDDSCCGTFFICENNSLWGWGLGIDIGGYASFVLGDYQESGLIYREGSRKNGKWVIQ